MQPFAPCTSSKAQLRTYRCLKGVIAPFAARGPIATKNGWPYYLIDTPQQTISVRASKMDGKRTFLVYERFGEPGNNKACHLCRSRLDLYATLRGLGAPEAQ